MFDESEPPSPAGALVALAPLDPEWQPILQVSNQVVLYNPTSHALSVRTRSRSPNPLARLDGRCPYCHQPMSGGVQTEDSDNLDADLELETEQDAHPRSRAANYFQLLEIANETASRPATPTTSHIHAWRDSSGASRGADSPSPFRADNMAEGYFQAFFREECRLGMGANGTVYLCQHMLDGNPLGHFAVKKIAVGQSHSYLLKILREVRLLETLHHPNIITYHHAWLETCQFSSFGPRIPTLHVLMQWAEGGSLDDLIDARLGRRPSMLAHLHPSSSPASAPDASPSPGSGGAPFSRTARIKAFRALQRAPPEERERLRRELGLGDGAPAAKPRDLKAVHLLSAEEVRALFADVISGLAFLHGKSILHLDLKPGNVLLTWDDGRLIPRAMLCDFGTSQDRLQSRARSGNTGTLEYASPESLPQPSGILMQVDSKADMWSVGMILHKLLFFRLPYRYASDGDAAADERGDAEGMDMLEREVANYHGFKSSPAIATTFESRRLPRAYLLLLESLLNVRPASRPSSDRVLSALHEGRLEPLPAARVRRTSSLIPVPIRRLTGELLRPAGQDGETDGDADVGARSPTPTGEDPHAKREDSVPLLGLPTPPAEPDPPSSLARKLRWIWNWGRSQDLAFGAVRIQRIWVRMMKSVVLAAKVSNIAQICEDSRPHSVIAAVLLALAIGDTLTDSIGSTLLFGLLHYGLVWLVRWSGRGCVPPFGADYLRVIW